VHDPTPDDGARARVRAAFACVLLVSALSTFAHADVLAPAQGPTSGGGHSFTGSQWLTSAAGQAGAGRAVGGNFVEVAGWMRRPGSSIVGVPVPAPEVARTEFSVRPNPSPAEAQFAIRLPASGSGTEAAPLEVRLYDVTGRLVRVLRADGVAGEHLLRWDGNDLRGTRARPGVYLARLRTGGTTLTRRLVLTH
jgi:hypothetical protein